MDQYLARLCWNSEGWISPTGESPTIEHGTYVTQNGYGHEEWIFNFQWVLDGWKYAFLQPVNDSYEKMQGRTIDVRLYTIGPKSLWYYVGHLPKCQVITEDQANAAWSEFVKRGWAKDMREQVKAIGGKEKGLRVPRFIFNVRFRTKEAEILDPKEPVGGADGIRRLRRYTLTLIQGNLKTIKAEWPDRRGRTALHRIGKQARKPAEGVVATLVERQLQNELFTSLRKQFGAAFVTMEEGFADVSLRQGKVVHLFEVKADPQPRRAIRQALGQLLQYAFARMSKGEKVGLLVVAAPGELDPLTREFVEHLQIGRGLPIHYLCLRRGTGSIDLPFNSIRVR
jgi:hypothetical protein